MMPRVFFCRVFLVLSIFSAVSTGSIFAAADHEASGTAETAPTELASASAGSGGGSSTGACWSTLETAATGYAKDPAPRPEALDKLQEAIKACAAFSLPEPESRDTRAAATWKACQEAVAALEAAPQDAAVKKAFWEAFQGWLWAHAWYRLNSSAAGYIRAKSGGSAADAAWLRKHQERIASRAESSKLELDAAARSVILDWMNDHEKALTAKNPDAILEACRIFCWSHAQDVALPGVVLEGLQKDNRMTKFAKYLDEQTTGVAQAKQETN